MKMRVTKMKQQSGRGQTGKEMTWMRLATQENTSGIEVGFFVYSDRSVGEIACLYASVSFDGLL